MNIFRHEYKYVKRLIRDTAPNVKNLFLLSTGNLVVFKRVLTFSKKYPNVKVSFKSFRELNFSAFRNECLNTFDIDTPYYMWLDSDERIITNGSIMLEHDMYQVNRIDGSGRFTTPVNRIFRSHLDGEWINYVHESFKTESNSLALCTDLKIQHLTSEVFRPRKKKLLYFELIKKQLLNCNESDKFNFLCLLILMASHDLKNYKLCTEIFNRNSEFLMNYDKLHVSKIFYYDMLLHAIMSYSRMQNNVPVDLVTECEKFATCKSSFFQLVRALSFNEKFRSKLLIFFNNKYNLLVDETVDFNNQDYKDHLEMQKLLIKLNNVKRITFRKSKKIQNRKNR